MGKRSLIFIHGGDAYTKHEDFLRALKTQEIRNPSGEKTTSWWSEKLHAELGDAYSVFTPSMPNKTNAHYDEWKIWFERHIELAEGELVLVGWSLGAMFLAKFLIESTLPLPVRALYLVAGPCGTYDDGAGNDCADFQFESTKLAAIERKVGKVVILHSKDDFVVPFEHALKYKEALSDAELVTFEDRNHFLQEEFPELVAKLKE